MAHSAIQINRGSGKTVKELRKTPPGGGERESRPAEERSLTDRGRLSPRARPGAVPGAPSPSSLGVPEPGGPAESCGEAAGGRGNFARGAVLAAGWWPGGGGSSAQQLKP